MLWQHVVCEHWRISSLPLGGAGMSDYLLVGSHARAMDILRRWLTRPLPQAAALMGPPGVGKSYTAAAVAELVQGTGGSVTWSGGLDLPTSGTTDLAIVELPPGAQLPADLQLPGAPKVLVTARAASPDGAAVRPWSRWGDLVIWLEPWSESEVAQAIQQAWAKVSSYPPPFSSRCLGTLSRLSGGLPRQLKRLLHSALLVAAARRASLVTSRDVWIAWHDSPRLLLNRLRRAA